MKNRTYRMYGFVPRNISPIQKGIQFGHAVVEYGLLYGETPEYQKWAREDKTFIILDGGTTNSFVDRLGTLNKKLIELKAQLIPHADFYEPDLGDQLTAFVFLVDNRVFDKETWPDFEPENSFIDILTGSNNLMHNWKMKFSDSEKEADEIVFLRNYLQGCKTA